jgi:hypothetical protein
VGLTPWVEIPAHIQVEEAVVIVVVQDATVVQQSPILTLVTGKRSVSAVETTDRLEGPADKKSLIRRYHNRQQPDADSIEACQPALAVTSQNCHRLCYETASIHAIGNK